MSVDFITTATGKRFHFEDPQPDEIDIADIAYALSHTNRWGGHAYPALSVAHHSVLVSESLMRSGATQVVQLQGLMHDAAEAYLGDIPTPIKVKMPEFGAMELLVMDAICQKFGVVCPFDHQVHLHDVEVRKWEYRDRMPDVGGVEAPMGNRPHLLVWNPTQAETAFLARFYDLTMALKEVA